MRRLIQCRVATWCPASRTNGINGALALSRSLWRLHVTSHFTTKCLRLYSSVLKPARDDWVSGTIINENIDTTSPDEVISLLPTLPPPTQANEERSSVVFLLSKGYATWLDSDDIFLRRAIEKLVKRGGEGSSDISKSQSIDVLAAVVDRIPTLSGAVQGGSETGTKQDDTVNRTPVDNGVEGVTFCASHNNLILPDLWDSVPEDQGKMDYVGAKKHSLITFSVRNSGDEPAAAALQTDDQDAEDIMTVRLPLANTMFYNGRESTMVALRLTTSTEHDELQLTSYLEPSHRTVVLPSTDWSNEKQLWATSTGAALSIPLVPLTEPREIKSGMGNIIRQLVGKAGEVAPASTELESAVTNYFEETGLQPHAVAVWALVIPERLVGKDSVTPCSPSDHPSRLLWYGATLRRVLSGGGGWGQKAGLLSLDPDSDFEEGQPSFPSVFDLDIENSQDQGEVLGRIASPGDYLRFFVASETAVSSSSNNSVAGNILELGTLPSSVDIVSSYEAESTNPNPNKTRPSSYPGRFGALSEGGLSFMQAHFSKRVQSKIDVPFSRITRRFYHRMNNGVINAARHIARRAYSASAEIEDHASSVDPSQPNVKIHKNGMLVIRKHPTSFKSARRVDITSAQQEKTSKENLRPSEKTATVKSSAVKNNTKAKQTRLIKFMRPNTPREKYVHKSSKPAMRSQKSLALRDNMDSDPPLYVKTIRPSAEMMGKTEKAIYKDHHDDIEENGKSKQFVEDEEEKNIEVGQHARDTQNGQNVIRRYVLTGEPNGSGSLAKIIKRYPLSRRTDPRSDQVPRVTFPRHVHPEEARKEEKAKRLESVGQKPIEVQLEAVAQQPDPFPTPALPGYSDPKRERHHASRGKGWEARLRAEWQNQATQDFVTERTRKARKLAAGRRRHERLEKEAQKFSYQGANQGEILVRSHKSMTATSGARKIRFLRHASTPRISFTPTERRHGRRRKMRESRAYRAQRGGLVRRIRALNDARRKRPGLQRPSQTVSESRKRRTANQNTYIKRQKDIQRSNAYRTWQKRMQELRKIPAPWEKEEPTPEDKRRAIQSIVDDLWKMENNGKKAEK